MRAQLIAPFKDVTAEGDVIELIVWKVPSPVPPSRHDYKYRAAYVVGGERVIGFDNEPGKGDHCHIDGHGLHVPGGLSNWWKISSPPSTQGEKHD